MPVIHLIRQSPSLDEVYLASQSPDQSLSPPSQSANSSWQAVTHHTNLPVTHRPVSEPLSRAVTIQLTSAPVLGFHCWRESEGDTRREGEGMGGKKGEAGSGERMLGGKSEAK